MIRSLQSLRALAIISIMLSHCFFLEGCLPSGLGPTGVSVFICLSGFLTYLSFKDKTVTLDIKCVAKRTMSKMRKFYPLHIATFVLALPFVIATVTGKDVFVHDAMKGIANLALVQSWIPIRSVYFSYNAVSWFLSTYLFFIVISPLFMKGIRRVAASKSPLRAAAVLLIAMVLCEFGLAYFFGHASYVHWILYVFPVTRSLDFAIGMLVAFGLTEYMARRQRIPGFIGAIGLGGVLCLKPFVLWSTQCREHPTPISIRRHGAFLRCFWSHLPMFLIFFISHQASLLFGLYLDSSKLGLLCILVISACPCSSFINW